MKETRIKNFFSAARSITPDADFVSHTKHQIMMSEQDPTGAVQMRNGVEWLFSLTSMRVGTALAALVLVAVFGTSAYMRSTNTLLVRSLSTDVISEQKELDFQVNIREAAYFDESAEQIAVALDQIAQ